MKIILSCDHAGVEYREEIAKHLTSKGFSCIQLGAKSFDQPLDYADAVDQAMDVFVENDIVILVCGTGIGISIRANRYPQLRAGVIYSKEVAKLAKQHNNLNVLCFGSRTQELSEILLSIDAFIDEEFEGGRHIRRLDKLNKPIIK